MPVNNEQESGDISYGTLATSVALLFFLAMLAYLGDRWAARFPPLPDFASYTQVKEMKAAFIDYISPIIEYHNEQLTSERERLQKSPR